MGTNGAEPADDGLPLFSVTALVEVWSQRIDGTQPLVDVGWVEDVVLPLRLPGAAGLGEPAPSERGPDRAISRFGHPGYQARSSRFGEGCGVIDSSYRVVIGDDPVRGGAVVVVDGCVQHAEHQAGPRLHVGPLLITAAEQVRGQNPGHEFHIQLATSVLVHCGHAGSDGVTNQRGENLGVCLGSGADDLVHDLGTVGERNPLDQARHRPAGERDPLGNA